MKIIEIKTTRSGQEVAYLFDESRGRVIKVLVEDMTRLAESDARSEDYDDFEPEPASRRRPRIRPQLEDAGLENDALIRGEDAKPPRSIVPPGLAGVFKPAGSPGAAEEIRNV